MTIADRLMQVEPSDLASSQIQPMTIADRLVQVEPTDLGSSQIQPLHSKFPCELEQAFVETPHQHFISERGAIGPFAIICFWTLVYASIAVLLWLLPSPGH